MTFEIFSLSFHIIYGDTIKSEGEFFMRSWGIIKRTVAAILLPHQQTKTPILCIIIFLLTYFFPVVLDKLFIALLTVLFLFWLGLLFGLMFLLLRTLGSLRLVLLQRSRLCNLFWENAWMGGIVNSPYSLGFQYIMKLWLVLKRWIAMDW